MGYSSRSLQRLGGLNALIALLYFACGCSVTNPVLSFSIHVSSFVKFEVREIRIRTSLIDQSLGTFGPGAGFKEMYYEGHPWPEKVTVNWVDSRSNEAKEITFDVSRPNQKTLDNHWFIVVIFFDDEIAVRVLDETTRWNPAKHGDSRYYGDDLVDRIAAYESWLAEPKVSNRQNGR